MIVVVKRLTQWRPRDGVRRDQTLRYWRAENARLVADVPNSKRYVQNHCIVGPDGSDPPYVGLGEVWFDSFETAEAALGSPEWKAVLDDAGTFMELEGVSAAWAEEHRNF